MKKLLLLALLAFPAYADNPHVDFVAGDGQVRTNGLTPFAASTTNTSAKFRMSAAITHWSFDDPIVFPNQEGLGHCHMFFGNQDINHHDTNDPAVTSDHNIRYDGTDPTGLTGRGLNLSGYWIPCGFNEAGVATGFRWNQIYYSGEGYSAAKLLIQEATIPDGLQIISFKSKFTCSNHAGQNFTPVNAGQGVYAQYDTFPTCDTQFFNTVNMTITFPNCLADPIRLTDMDNDSDPTTTSPSSSHDHMADGGWGGNCPPTHPKLIPQIIYNLAFPITNVNTDTSLYSLASDFDYITGQNKCAALGTGNGCTAHGDWMNGWDQDTLILALDKTDGCMGSDNFHCAAGQINGTMALSDTASGLKNWELSGDALGTTFTGATPFLSPRPNTQHAFYDNTNPSAFAPALTLPFTYAWSGTGTCENPDGTNYSRTYSQSEIQASLVTGSATLASGGTATNPIIIDWLNIGSDFDGVTGGGAYDTTNHEMFCSFCPIVQITDATGRVGTGEGTCPENETYGTDH